MSDDGFRSGPDHVGFFQLFAACDGNYSQFGREAFHVFGFFFQEALRDEQRQINILVASGLEPRIEFSLQHLPNRIAIGFDDHTAFHDLGRFGHVTL